MNASISGAAAKIAGYVEPIKAFLGCETPASWLSLAQQPENLPVLLADHANCELKAAQTAQALMWRYGTPRPGDIEGIGVKRSRLLNKLSRLAREELRHFEQVIAMMNKMHVPYVPTSASSYAAGMLELVTTHEPWTMVDKLIVGAFIEARSCERFAALAPSLPEPVQSFYLSLLKSESRHFTDYLALAEEFAGESIGSRVAAFKEREVELIERVDPQFNFHSGRPC